MSQPPEPSPTLGERAKYLGMVFAYREQRILAGMVLISLIGIGIWNWQRSVRVDQIIDIDQRETKTAAFQIDLNQAPWTELSNLPGIGDRLAKDIVAYREHIGSFASIKMLQEVSGIGPRTVEQIAPFLAPISGEANALAPMPRTASKR